MIEGLLGEGSASVLPSFRVFFTQENLPSVHSAVEPSFGAAVLVGLKLSPSHTGCVELSQRDLSLLLTSLSKAFFSPNCSVCSDNQLHEVLVDPKFFYMSMTETAQLSTTINKASFFFCLATALSLSSSGPSFDIELLIFFFGLHYELQDLI